MSDATFFRILDPDVPAKGPRLVDRIAVTRTVETHSEDVFVREPASFAAIPKSPFAYWVSDRIRQIFEECPPLEAVVPRVEHGASTKDDFRYLRAWWEVDPERIGYSIEDSEEGRGWIHFAKGGSYSAYYAEIHLLVNWFNNAEEIEADVLQKYPYLKGNAEWVLHRENTYFQPGLTWPRRSQKGLSVRALPSGCSFADKGPAIIPQDETLVAALLAITNSRPYFNLVDAQMAFGSYEVGVLQRTPIPPADSMKSIGPEPVWRIFELKREFAEVDETLHEFWRPSLARARGRGIVSTFEQNRERHDSAEGEARRLHTQIERDVLRLYRMERQDLQDASGPDLQLQSDSACESDLATATANLLSWCFGCAAGRWDVRLAETSEAPSDRTAPLDRLPRFPRGALVAPDGRIARREEIGSRTRSRTRRAMPDLPVDQELDAQTSITADSYPLDVAWDGILVDDADHPRDTVRNVRAVLAQLWGNQVSDIEEEAVEILRGDGRTPKGLRGWFRNRTAARLGQNFFDFHIQCYSKSRRKAPIYWRLCSSPGRGQSNYGVWLYYHRLTDDTLWKVLGDYVKPRRELEERRLRETREKLQNAEGSGARQLEEEIQEHTDFLEEITWFEEEIRKVAESGWAPNLDDGVIINMAPLHKVIPWKEPEKIWKRLQKGEYDWSHMAMRYWPERVKEKCRTDKSLAIAHDRLDLYEGD